MTLDAPRFCNGGGLLGGTESDPNRQNYLGVFSKRQNGASVPTGNAELQARRGQPRFFRSAHPSLGISGGVALYKGTVVADATTGFTASCLPPATCQSKGTCAGTNRETFRINIRNSASGALVYDNAPGPDDLTSNAEAIGAGNFVVHKFQP